jgi:hypothetical protein
MAVVKPAPCGDIAAPIGEGGIVRAKLALGRLRRDSGITSSVVELGSHPACDGCDRPIATTEVEMRVRFSDGGSLFFHVPCFTAWYRDAASDEVAFLRPRDMPNTTAWHPQPIDRGDRPLIGGRIALDAVYHNRSEPPEVGSALHPREC